MEVFFQLIHIQTVQEGLLGRQPEKHLPEQGCRFLHVRITPDFPAVFRFPNDSLTQNRTRLLDVLPGCKRRTPEV